MAILSLEEAAENCPLSKKSLYRVAREDPDSPFRMRKGKWMVVESDLEDWVRAGECGTPKGSADPMPRRKGSRGDNLLERAKALRGEP